MILAVTVILIVIASIIVVSSKKKNQKRKVEGIRNFNADKTLVDESGNYAIAFDYNRKKISLSEKNHPVIIEHFVNIKDVKIDVDGETKLKGVVTGAIIGEIIAGNKGKLIGAIALSKKVEYIKSIDLVIEFYRRDNIVISFFKGDIKKNRIDFYINQAEEWFKEIKNLLQLPQSVEDEVIIDGTDSFLFLVEDIYTIVGRGIMAVGIVNEGHVSVGDNDIVLKKINGKIIPLQVISIEMDRKTINKAVKGNNVGLIVSGITKDQIELGDIITLNRL